MIPTLFVAICIIAYLVFILLLFLKKPSSQNNQTLTIITAPSEEEISSEKEKLVRVTEECLKKGVQAAQAFTFLGDVGHVIECHAKRNGFSVVRDFCGHGVGIQFHEEPEVLHYGRKSSGMLLVPGMTLTIEPMLNMGTWKVVMDQSDGWTVYTEDRLPSAQWEYTILITESEPEILAH